MRFVACRWDNTQHYDDTMQVLKDITNRFQLLQGRHVRYIPGWDCHGLPIELKALAEGQLDRRAADALTIRDTARACALLAETECAVAASPSTRCSS